MKKQKIIWTRSLSDFDKDIKLLKCLPVDWLHIPCIQKQTLELSGTKLNKLSQIDEPCFIIFTSMEAVKQAWKLDSLKKLMQQNINVSFAPKTILFLKNLNLETFFFKDCTSAKEMYKKILKQIDKKTLLILPGPQKRAFNLDHNLKQNGYQTLRLDLYKTIKKAHNNLGEVLTKKDFAEIKKNELIFFASPSAVIGFIKSLKGFLNFKNNTLTAFCIGSSTKDEAQKYFLKLKVLKNTSLEALKEALTS